MMKVFFLDASALVKRYLSEVGSHYVHALFNSPLPHTIAIAQITPVEVAAALSSRHRAPQGISLRMRDRAVGLLAKHCQEKYRLISLNPEIVDLAVQLTQTYRLRGYDAVQLASAVVANNTLTAAGLPPLTFATADGDLISAAEQLGLAAENPNDQP
jgi:uncharacterized protein